MYNAAVKLALEYDVSVRTITNAEMHAAFYAGPFLCPVEIAPVVWDLNSIPYLASLLSWIPHQP